MGYRRTILKQWSRRDWLTVVIIAVATAFLVGTTLLLLSAGSHAATVSDGLETSTMASHYESVDAAQEATGGEATVFPIAVVDDGAGTEVTVIGVPPDAPGELDDATTAWETATIPPPSEPGAVRGPVAEDREMRLTGRHGTETVTATPRQGDSIFPPGWYTAGSETVEALGPTGAIAIDTGSEITREDATLLNFDRLDTGVPLISALAFLLAGMNEVLQLVAVATVGGAVIVMVVLYSVTRISVRERLETIEIIRSTGSTPARILSLFGLRSTGIALTGILGGSLAGVALTKLSVALATWAGISITLEPKVTWPVLHILGPMLITLIGVSSLAGVLAARTAATAPPTALRSRAGSRPASGFVHRIEARLPTGLSPSLLDWRTVVPTAATLTVFVLLVLLIGGIGSAIAPLGASGSGTITSAGAPHPIDSRLDARTADALQAQGIEASPEIVLAQVNDGQPYLARGANYSDFAAVTGAELLEGHEPTAPDEAVIGRGFAKTQDVAVGDTITLGGSDQPAVARVTVVGVYETGGLVDDQLIVPLETGHHLSLESGTVHVIRTAGEADAVLDGSGDSDEPAGERVVRSVSAPERVVVDEQATIMVHLRNDGSTAVDRTIGIDVGRETYERQVALDPDEEDRIEIDHAFGEAGTRTVAAQGHSQTVTVLAPNAPVLPETLPGKAPPGETLLVPVTTSDGAPIQDAAVTVDGEETTVTDGTARVQLPEREGTYELAVTNADQDEATHEIRVADGQDRLLGADLALDPRTGTPETTPEATVTMANHWPDERTQEVSIVAPSGEQTRTVSLAPGESLTMERPLGGEGSDQRMPPGRYDVAVTADGEAIATETYEVLAGDFDLGSIPEETQYRSGAAMGQVIETTVGNIQVLLGTMVALAGLMTIGSTTAAFAQAVHARRKAIVIHRATGARPLRVMRIVALDACKLAVPAALLAATAGLVALYVLDAIGLMSIFGVRVMTEMRPAFLLATLVGAVGIAVCSAVLALLPAVRSSPMAVLRGRSPRGSENRSDDEATERGSGTRWK